MSSHFIVPKKNNFSRFSDTPYYSTLTRGVKRQLFLSVIADVMPLPLGEVSPEVTERASHRGKNLCAAISCVFVRARLSLRLPFFVSVLTLSGASRQLSQRESLCKTKSGAHRWSSLCVPHFVLFCTERRTRAPRAARRESGANHKPLSLFNK